MANKRTFPSLKELQNLPICDREDALKYYTDESIKRKDGRESGPFRMLVPAPRFVDLIKTLANFKLSPRLLRAWVSLKLIAPPTERDEKKELYVYPDHFEQVAIILTLRYNYQLPLRAIQQVIEHFPGGLFHVITSRKLTTEQLLDAAKMLPDGYEPKDIFLAKACDAMLEDVLPADQALAAATEENNGLQSIEEQLILSRLDEIKDWVKSGGRQKFVRREAAQDLQDLAWRHRFSQRIRNKMLARQAREIREKLIPKG